MSRFNERQPELTDREKRNALRETLAIEIVKAAVGNAQAVLHGAPSVTYTRALAENCVMLADEMVKKLAKFE